MPKPHLIGPRPATATTDSDVSRSRAGDIPYDLLKAASRRLGIMSLLGAVLWVVGTVMYHVAARAMTFDSPPQLGTTDAIAGVSVLVCLALFFYTRRDRGNPAFILDLGLVHMVITALALGLVFHWERQPVAGHIEPIISWIGVVVLMFAAIVPAAPVKTLLAGLVAASMNPAGMLIAKARGVWDFDGAGSVILMHYPDYLVVGVSVVVSHVVTKLGRQVTRAREMGSYRLVQMLGKGGMGEVWQATHHMLARDAAIKLIQPDLLSRTSGKDAELMRRRFEQEAKATASLRSPHTVELYDFGVSEDGSFYYVMELLDGIDLETLVRQFGPLPAPRVVELLRQVCQSLAEAHRAGMVHRDIKPTNIFICRMGVQYDFVKVLDFGLVKTAVLDGESRMTRDGATTGTPAYMSPEVAMASDQIDGRADLYGLGCVAYWLLTGTLVFEEKNPMAMVMAHVQKPAEPPSRKTELQIPEPLDRLVMACLAKLPADRPATPEALVDMLDECKDAGVWTPRDAEAWWLTNRPERVARAGADSPSMSALSTQ